MGMHNTDRIQVSHAGALPRPADLQHLFAAGPAGEEAFREALPGAVAEVVDRQVSAGVDIVNDGEVSKRGLFIGYVRDRMAGLQARSFPARCATPAPRASAPTSTGSPRRSRTPGPGATTACRGSCRPSPWARSSTGSATSADRVTYSRRRIQARGTQPQIGGR
jgi:methionine synthase II (cobalamin-independent)